MDAKVTLSFKRTVAEKAKLYAARNNVSLSRLVEYLLSKATSSTAASFEDFPVSEWVNQLAEGPADYRTKPRSRKSVKKEFYNRRK